MDRPPIKRTRVDTGAESVGGSLVIAAGQVLTLDAKGTLLAPGWILADNGAVTGIGSGEPPGCIIKSTSALLDASEMVALPGFVNAHTHPEQSLFRGIRSEGPLETWLEACRPFYDAMTPEDVSLAYEVTFRENLRSGVTAIVSHHRVSTSPAHVAAAVRIAGSSRQRAVIARAWRDLGGHAEPVQDCMRDISLIRELLAGASSSRVLAALGPMVPRRCSTAGMQELLRYSDALDMQVHMHVAESDTEEDSLFARESLRSIPWLDTLGALNARLQLVHCLAIQPDEIDLLARHRVLVVTCLTSNLFLTGAGAPIGRMWAAGVPLAIGTDGAASNGRQDMYFEMKSTLLLSRTRLCGPPLSSEAVLRMATHPGARIFSKPLMGQIVVGAPADIQLLNLNTVGSVGRIHLTDAIVLDASPGDVDSVLVGGELLLHGASRPTQTRDGLVREARTAFERLRRHVDRGDSSVTKTPSQDNSK